MKTYKLLPVLFFIFLSCEENNESDFAGILSPKTTTQAETFDWFNERFHRDTAFQRSRIAFPIGGHFIDGESSHNWTISNWELLKEPVKDTINNQAYKHSLHKTATTVTEKYWIENSGFKVERRFKKTSGKWFLIYYDDINL